MWTCDGLALQTLGSQWLICPKIFRITGVSVSYTNGHFTHETESPWPLHFKHSHWWTRWSRWSKFAASHYAWGTKGVCGCKMDAKSTYMASYGAPNEYVSWSLGLFFKNHLLEVGRHGLSQFHGHGSWLVCEVSLNMTFSVIRYFMSLWQLFWMTLMRNKWANIIMDGEEFICWPKPYLLLSTTFDETLSWMMDEFIRWPKLYLLLSTTCDEILSRRIGIWMRNRLVIKW